MVYRQTARSEQVRAASQGRILKAARRLFAGQGYDETSMREVASAARTSIGNLYFYFRSKEGILSRLLEESLRAAWARGDEVAERIPVGPARLAVMLLCNFDAFLTHDPDLTRLLADGTRHRHIGDWIVELNRERWMHYVSENAPELIGPDVELAIVAWRGASRACIEAKVLGEVTLPSDDVATFAVRWNLRALGLSADVIEEALRTAQSALDATRRAGVTP